MKTAKIKTLENPMKLIIDKAISLGYGHNPDLNKWDQCHHIKDWIAYRFNVYVWVVPHSDFRFVPYSQELREGATNRKKYAFSECHMQAFIEGLLSAINHIK